MWSTFWITLERRIHLIFMVANFLLMAYLMTKVALVGIVVQLVPTIMDLKTDLL